MVYAAYIHDSSYCSSFYFVNLFITSGVHDIGCAFVDLLLCRFHTRITIQEAEWLTNYPLDLFKTFLHMINFAMLLSNEKIKNNLEF